MHVRLNIFRRFTLIVEMLQNRLGTFRIYFALTKFLVILMSFTIIVLISPFMVRLNQNYKFEFLTKICFLTKLIHCRYVVLVLYPLLLIHYSQKLDKQKCLWGGGNWWCRDQSDGTQSRMCYRERLNLWHDSSDRHERGLRSMGDHVLVQ